MRMISAICTQCGAHMEVNEQLSTSMCPYCGAIFVIDKSPVVNNFFGNSAPNPETLFEIAQKEYDQADYSSSQKHITDALQSDPQNPKYLLLKLKLSCISSFSSNTNQIGELFSIISHSNNTVYIFEAAESILNLADNFLDKAINNLKSSENRITASSKEWDKGYIEITLSNAKKVEQLRLIIPDTILINSEVTRQKFNNLAPKIDIIQQLIEKRFSIYGRAVTNERAFLEAVKRTLLSI